MRDFEDYRWQSKDDLPLYARIYAGQEGGEKLPVLCLHGLTRNSKDFADVAPWIVETTGRHVIVPDIRGRGRSGYDSKPANYVPSTYTADILALLDSLEEKRAIFLGTSMGGIITMLTAAKRSKAVAAAILNDVGPSVDRRGLERIRGYVGKKVEIKTWDDAADYMRMLNEAAFPGYGSQEWAALAERTFVERDGKILADYDPAISSQAKAGRVRAATAIAWLLYLNMAWRRPTLVIRGGLSDILSVGTAKWMRRLASKTSVTQVPNIGHAPMLTENSAREALSTFLARVP